MSEARPNFNVRELLQDDDCEIRGEYDNVVEGALDMRRKFSLIVTQARRLRTSCSPNKPRSTVSTLGTSKSCHTTGVPLRTYAKGSKHKAIDCSRTERR